MNVLLYDAESQETYYSGYRDWEGTLLCKKEMTLNTGYLDVERGEDTPVIHYLSSRNSLFRIVELPHLYIYIYHGNNTWDEGHFNSYFIQSKLMEEEVNLQVQNIVNLSYYSLTGD